MICATIDSFRSCFTAFRRRLGGNCDLICFIIIKRGVTKRRRGYFPTPYEMPLSPTLGMYPRRATSTELLSAFRAEARCFMLVAFIKTPSYMRFNFVLAADTLVMNSLRTWSAVEHFTLVTAGDCNLLLALIAMGCDNILLFELCVRRWCTRPRAHD